MQETYDIVIIGGGNAALCAALTSGETGARVLILEAAPKPIEAEIRATRAISDACMMVPWAPSSTATAKRNM